MSENWFVKVTGIVPLGGHRLKLVFSDGAVGEHDFGNLVAKDGEMVLPLRDPAFFAKAFIEWGAPTWPNGFDLAPHALYDDMKAAGELRREAAE